MPGVGVALSGAGGGMSPPKGGLNDPGGCGNAGPIGGGAPSAPPAGPPCGMHTPPIGLLASAGNLPGHRQSKTSAHGAVLQPAAVHNPIAAAECNANNQ